MKSNPEKKAVQNETEFNFEKMVVLSQIDTDDFESCDGSGSEGCGCD